MTGESQRDIMYSLQCLPTVERNCSALPVLTAGTTLSSLIVHLPCLASSVSRACVICLSRLLIRARSTALPRSMPCLLPLRLFSLSASVSLYVYILSCCDVSPRHRTQTQNRSTALKKLKEMIEEAWNPPKERQMRTGISKRGKAMRRADKEFRSKVKDAPKSPFCHVNFTGNSWLPSITSRSTVKDMFVGSHPVTSRMFDPLHMPQWHLQCVHKFKSWHCVSAHTPCSSPSMSFFERSFFS